MVSNRAQGGYSSLRTQRLITGILLLLVLFFLAFTNITRFPKTWFDEGSHLHVPKTLVKYGVYADYSSDGFRYYGPTIGVGPTVMLPVAAVFKLFGIGLLQARIVMGLYLIAASTVFYLMAKELSNHAVALVASALLISSRTVFILEYGRQLLGEVPGLFFLVLGLWLWFLKWENNDRKRLVLIGVLLGLSIITKYQHLLFLLPMLAISWVLNMAYYKTASHQHFILPALIAGICFSIWQLITIRYLGPATMFENLALLRSSAEGAAFTIDLNRISGTLMDLKDRSAYLVALLPSIVYAFLISISPTRESQKWSVLFILVILNMGWYVLASIGWIRYAFLGLAVSSIFTARFFYDITDSFNLGLTGKRVPEILNSLRDSRYAARLVIIVWIAWIILLPMAKNISEIAFPGPDTAIEMSQFLNQNVPKDKLIETWEPEMGFLTDHNYHFPPNQLLAVAIQQAYGAGEPVQDQYDFVQTENPDYLLVGEFAKRTGIYPLDECGDRYRLVFTAGEYDLYQRVD